MPPYEINGTVRIGNKEGYSITTIIVDNTGGQTVNIAISDGSELADTVLVTLTHVSSQETLTTYTNDLGQYILNLSNLTSYEVGDSITIEVNTITSNTNTGLSLEPDANAKKVILVDKKGNLFDEKNPLIIFQADRLNGHAHIIGNVDTYWTVSGSNPPSEEKITFPDGTSFKRTMTYNANNNITFRSKWEKV